MIFRSCREIRCGLNGNAGRSVVLGLALLTLCRAAGASDATWWDPNWHFRRHLTVTDTVRGSGPTTVAMVEFPTLGKINPDGSDIRVIDGDNKEMPLQVIASGLEDRACILFEAIKHGHYQLYFGNSNAKATPLLKPLEAGLVLESREFAESNVDNWKQTQDVIAKNQKITGRWWCPSTTMSFNPLGPMDHAICTFTGYIRCPADGTYTFATNSVDASFVFVNDKPVAEWPGWHGPGGGEHATHQGKLELRAGVHRFQYVTAFRGWGACTVGWQRPGDATIVHMNAESFVGTLITKISPVEGISGSEADFQWTYDDDLAMEGRRVTSVKFESMSPAKGCKWDFGDGTTSSELAPLHVYLEPGVYSVTLEADGKRTTQKARIQPERGHLGHPYEKRIAAYADMIKNYETKALSINALMEMGQICHEAQRFDGAMRAFRAAVDKGLLPRDGEEGRWVLRLYDLYKENGKFDDAIAICNTISENKDAPPPMAAQALVFKAEVLFDYQNKIDEADAVYKTVLRRFKPEATDYVRVAYLRLGELALMRGDVKTARKILEDTERSDMWKKRVGDFEFVNGSHELNFEEFMRQNEFEAAMNELQSWEWERPTIQLTGVTRHLRGRVYLASKQYAMAIRELDRGMAADKYAPFIDEALFWKGQAYDELKQHDKAVECYKKLVEEHAASNLAGKAKEKLK
jgi:tetratricopeptide (TPR) repeat protein